MGKKKSKNPALPEPPEVIYAYWHIEEDGEQWLTAVENIDDTASIDKTLVGEYHLTATHEVQLVTSTKVVKT